MIFQVIHVYLKMSIVVQYLVDFDSTKL